MLGDKLEQAFIEAKKFEKMNFVTLYKQQIDNYFKNVASERPPSIFNQSDYNNQNSHILTKTELNNPPAKVEIESLLARISAIQASKKEKLDA